LSKTLQIIEKDMRGNSEKNKQQSFLYQGLSEQLNPRHPLYKLEALMPWDYFEKEFKEKYIDFGRPGLPIRLMASLLILKQMYNLSDESVVARWTENPYWQYFSGEGQFRWDLPCDPTELVKFRKRIGPEGAEKIFEVSIKMHGKDAEEKEVIADTTCHEKNVTFPTDTKLHLSIVRFCWRTAEAEGVKLRQSYRFVIPKLLWQSRYRNRKNRKHEAAGAARKIKARAGRLLRDLERKLGPEQKARLKEELLKCHKILGQQKNDKGKIYSFHEPGVSCIAKGKQHKKYEFGSKASILITKNSGIIVGAKNFQGNPYDGKTLEPTLGQYKKFFLKMPDVVLVDEGYRLRKMIEGTKVVRIHRRENTGYSKWQFRQRFRRRASIEPVIGHLKTDYRLDRNYLKGAAGDDFNLYMASAARNFKMLLAKLLILLKLFFKKFRSFFEIFDMSFLNFAHTRLFQG
jgi:IS5 family transposase